jgi:type IV pilus assembly protein PilA
LLCPNCGASIADHSQFCSNCGKSIQQTPSPVSPTVTPTYSGPAQTSGKAIASLVCGIINVFPLFIVAIVLGHISLSEIKKSSGRIKGEGLAIAGLVMGYLGIVAIPFFLIVAAIAIPNLLRAKIAANESSAIGSVRNVITAEISYQSTHTDAGFTCSLSDLAAAGLIDFGVASGQKTGYIFDLQNCGAEAEGGPISKFQLTATPFKFNQTGVRAFCSDESGVVRLEANGSAQDCLDHGTQMD